MKNTFIKRIRKRVFASALACLFACSVLQHVPYFPLSPLHVYAEETKKTGTVQAGVTGLRIRTSTDTSSTANVITKVKGGFPLDILDTVQTSDTYSWYHVGFYLNGTYTTGYVTSEFVDVNENIDYTEESDFEAYLNEQGFPESYKAGLRALHEKYPKWIFQADFIDKNWDTVVEKENVLGRSLIYGSAKSSWKSTDSDAYNWEDGTWYELDSGGWVQASPALVSYALDPRNFLNEDNIFMFEDLSYNSSVQSENGVSNIIAGTFMENSSHDLSYDGVDYTYPSGLMYAGRASGVSPYHLATRIIQEQGKNGQGNSISGNVTGYKNLYNYYNQGAYKTATVSAVVNGLIYASKTDDKTLRPWNSRMKSMVGGAIYIGSRYINRGQNTIYYEKFDMVTPYTHQYMTNVLAPRSESKTAANAYSESTKQKTAIVFQIPVYKNMPANVCKLPEGDGNPNNALSELYVDDYEITPTFDIFTENYDLIVEHNISQITLHAAAIADDATVRGAGSHTLQVGDNEIHVTVTSGNGNTRTYILHVVRKEGSSSGGGSGNSGETAVETPGFSTDYYVNNDNHTISKIGVGTSGSDLLAHISFTGGAYGKVFDANGKENTDVVGTGGVVVIYDKSGNEIGRYSIVIYGDVNGDGEITSMDLLYVKRHVLQVRQLSGVYELAADANRGNDGITSIDMLYIKRHILEIRYIEQ